VETEKKNDTNPNKLHTEKSQSMHSGLHRAACPPSKGSLELSLLRDAWFGHATQAKLDEDENRRREKACTTEDGVTATKACPSGLGEKHCEAGRCVFHVASAPDIPFSDLL